jgi:hypothetical protein
MAVMSKEPGMGQRPGTGQQRYVVSRPTELIYLWQRSVVLPFGG